MKILSLSSLVFSIGSLLSLNIQASDGVINFSGLLTDTTCDVAVTSTGANNVVLPTLPVTLLSASDSHAGVTSFTISLSHCSGSATGASAYFESGPTVEATTGLLNNTDTGAGAATNVSLQLLDGSNANAPIMAGDGAQLEGTTYVSIDTAEDNTTVTNLPYAVQYYSAAGSAKAGTVASQVTYSIQYQ